MDGQMQAGRLIGLPQRMTDDVVLLDGHVLADAEAHLAGEDAEILLRFEAPQASTLDQTRAAIGRWIAASASVLARASAMSRGRVMAASR